MISYIATSHVENEVMQVTYTFFSLCVAVHLRGSYTSDEVANRTKRDGNDQYEHQPRTWLDIWIDIILMLFPLYTPVGLALSPATPGILPPTILQRYRTAPIYELPTTQTCVSRPIADSSGKYVNLLSAVKRCNQS